MAISVAAFGNRHNPKYVAWFGADWVARLRRAIRTCRRSTSRPTGYGLGKWGWVTASIPKGKIPTALFREWIDTSYRLQAPKRLLKGLG